MSGLRGENSLRGYLWAGTAVVAVLVTGVVLGMVFATNTAEAQGARTFSSQSGMMLNYINAANTDDFEAVMRKVAEALQNSDDADRNRQADGWKVYRAKEPGTNNSVLYVWFLDPAVANADYAVSQILNEAFPSEVQALYEQFNGSFAAGQAMVNLDLVVDF